jgi:uncharacterized protein YdeI (YjbR/CyaY-like superfamily)
MMSDMGRKDPRVDVYIKKSAAFARPVLKHLRKIVHAGCSEVEETIKWQFPHFDYKGMMCSMASFKEHCAFGFWKAELIFDGNKSKLNEAMGHFGRITSINDLPAEKTLVGYVVKAAALNDAGVKSPPRARPKGKKKLVVPPDLTAALQRNAKARKTFDGFSYSNKKDYVEWISEAKRAETRGQRLKTTVEWMAEGKVRNWKYL